MLWFHRFPVVASFEQQAFSTSGKHDPLCKNLYVYINIHIYYNCLFLEHIKQDIITDNPNMLKTSKLRQEMTIKTEYM